MQPRITLFTDRGVPDADVRTYRFSTGDKLGLSLQRYFRGDCDDVVLVVHGLTTSTDMFVMPEHENFVRHLLDHGFTDVWCVDFRMSNRHPYNLLPHRYTLDDIALFDHPATVRTIRDHVGERRLHVVSHCLGAASFAMSLFGGAVRGIASFTANSVALTPRVPPWSRLKLSVAPFAIEYLLGFPYINPNWAEDAGLTRGKLFAKVVSLGHPECDVPACHMLSMMWGSGRPALYHHEQLDEVTHRRGGDLYGPTSVHYYRHVRKMLRAGRAVKYDATNAAHRPLPDDYLADAGAVETPTLLLTGANNRVFADSNVVCHRELERRAPGRHRLHVFDGYGHQDVFMGRNAARDVFPVIRTFMESARA